MEKIMDTEIDSLIRTSELGSKVHIKSKDFLMMAKELKDYRHLFKMMSAPDDDDISDTIERIKMKIKAEKPKEMLGIYDNTEYECPYCGCTLPIKSKETWSGYDLYCMLCGQKLDMN